jgi:hypothetical protein
MPDPNDSAATPGDGDSAGDGLPGFPVPAGGADGGSDVDVASVDSGHAPAAGDDAGPVGGAPPATAAAAPAGGFTFAGKAYKDVAAAEAEFKSLGGRVPGLQKTLAERESALAEREAELQRMHRALSLTQAEREQGKDGKKVEPEPGFADSLLKSGDLDVIAELAETKGMKSALYTLADALEQRVGALVKREVGTVNETVQGITHQDQVKQTISRVVTAARQLSPDYPELAESENPEVQEARQEILAIYKSYPPEFTLHFPGDALRLAVIRYRDTHGTPTWAQPPGSSGSPSAGIVKAAEAAAAAATAPAIDGTATPRPQSAPMTRQQALEKDLDDADRSSRIVSADGFDFGVRRRVAASAA